MTMYFRPLSPNRRRRRSALSTLVALATVAALPVLSACTSTGDISNPLVRKATYFSYLNGDDLRAQCHPGALDTLRLTYNGRYRDQVRIYNLNAEAGRPLLREKIITDVIINQGFTLNSLSSRLGGQNYKVPLSNSEADSLWSQIAAANAFGAPQTGLRLDSEKIWWLAVGCHSGSVFFHAWQQTESSGPPPFFPHIAALDPSGLPFASAAPPPITQFDSPAERSGYTTFTLEIGKNGLVL